MKKFINLLILSSSVIVSLGNKPSIDLEFFKKVNRQGQIGLQSPYGPLGPTGPFPPHPHRGSVSNQQRVKPASINQIFDFIKKNPLFTFIFVSIICFLFWLGKVLIEFYQLIFRIFKIPAWLIYYPNLWPFGLLIASGQSRNWLLFYGYIQIVPFILGFAFLNPGKTSVLIVASNFVLLAIYFIHSRYLVYLVGRRLKQTHAFSLGLVFFPLYYYSVLTRRVSSNIARVGSI